MSPAPPEGKPALSEAEGTADLAPPGDSRRATPEPLAAAIRYPAEVRRVVQIPESKLLVMGVAIGYPDNEAPANCYRSGREPIGSLTTWRGF